LASHAKESNTDTLAIKPQKVIIGEREVLIYPNPTQGALKIEILGPQPEQSIQLILTDINGRTLARKETTKSIYIYDMTFYANGIYFLRVVIDGKKQEWKIIKK